MSCSIHEPNQAHSSQQRGCSPLPHQHLPDIHQGRSTAAHSGVFPAGLHSCHASHHDADWHAHPGSCVSLWCAFAGELSNSFSLQPVPSTHTVASVSQGYAPDPGVCLFALTCQLLGTSWSGLLQSPVCLPACMSHPASSVVSVQVNESEINDPNKPLSFGDFVEVVPCESPQLFAKHPVHLNSGNYLFPRPQHGKHRPPVEQQRQQLNSIYSLPSDAQHSPTNMWRVSSTELTTPPQRHGAEARRPVPSA